MDSNVVSLWSIHLKLIFEKQGFTQCTADKLHVLHQRFNFCFFSLRVFWDLVCSYNMYVCVSIFLTLPPPPTCLKAGHWPVCVPVLHYKDSCLFSVPFFIPKLEAKHSSVQHILYDTHRKVCRGLKHSEHRVKQTYTPHLAFIHVRQIWTLCHRNLSFLWVQYVMFLLKRMLRNVTTHVTTKMLNNSLFQYQLKGLVVTASDTEQRWVLTVAF